MLWWDERLLAVMTKSNIKMVEGVRYMEDIRIWLMVIRLSQRWTDKGLMYKSSWRVEEKHFWVAEAYNGDGRDVRWQATYIELGNLGWQGH